MRGSSPGGCGSPGPARPNNARTAELSRAQTLSSTADRLSEMEVLSIARDLNENINQVTIGLAGKLKPSQTTGRTEIDSTSRPRVPILVQLAHKRDLTGLTCPLWSYLSCQATNMTLSGDRSQEFVVLKHAYQRLSTSGEHHGGVSNLSRMEVIYPQSPPPPPPCPASPMEQLAGLLNEMVSFSSPQSFGLVRTMAFEIIASTIRTAQRLEAAFMVDVTSSNMALLLEAPDTGFDQARMANEFESDGASRPGGGDEIGLRVEKSICGGPGGIRRAKILLKARWFWRRTSLEIESRDGEKDCGETKRNRMSLGVNDVHGEAERV